MTTPVGKSRKEEGGEQVELGWGCGEGGKYALWKIQEKILSSHVGK